MSERILLIEDDPRLAEMVKNYLGESGFSVTIAPTGRAGLSLHDRPSKTIRKSRDGYVFAKAQD